MSVADSAKGMLGMFGPDYTNCWFFFPPNSTDNPQDYNHYVRFENAEVVEVTKERPANVAIWIYDENRMGKWRAIPSTVFPKGHLILAIVCTVLAMIVFTTNSTETSDVQTIVLLGILGLGIAWVLYAWFYNCEPQRGAAVAIAIIAATQAHQAYSDHEYNKAVERNTQTWRDAVANQERIEQQGGNRGW